MENRNPVRPALECVLAVFLAGWVSGDTPVECVLLLGMYRIGNDAAACGVDGWAAMASQAGAQAISQKCDVALEETKQKPGMQTLGYFSILLTSSILISCS